MQESDRTPAKPSASQAHKEEGKHCLPLNHGKGDRSGRKDKPSSTQKGSGGEYSALELKVGPGGRVKEKEDLNADEFRKPGQSYMEAKLEHQERLYQDYKDELPTDGVCRVICSDSVASPTLSSCSLKNLSPRVRVRTLITVPLTMGKDVGIRTIQQEKLEEERNTVLSIVDE